MPRALAVAMYARDLEVSWGGNSFPPSSDFLAYLRRYTSEAAIPGTSPFGEAGAMPLRLYEKLHAVLAAALGGLWHKVCLCNVGAETINYLHHFGGSLL